MRRDVIVGILLLRVLDAVVLTSVLLHPPPPHGLPHASVYTRDLLELYNRQRPIKSATDVWSLGQLQRSESECVPCGGGKSFSGL